MADMIMHSWARKPKPVEAVQLTEDNFMQVVRWADGRPFNGFSGPMLLLKRSGTNTCAAVLTDYVIDHGDRFSIMSKSAFEEQYHQVSSYPVTFPDLDVVE